MSSARQTEHAPHIGVELSEINHTEDINGSYEISYVLGSGPTSNGRQYTIEAVETEVGLPVSKHYGQVERLHRGVKNIAQGRQNNFAREIGYGYVIGGPEDDFVDLTTIPTAEFINTALGKIYGEQNPPFEFIDVKPEKGKFDELLLVRLVSQGMLPVPTPADKTAFNFFSQNVLGLARINHEVADLLIDQAAHVMAMLDAKDPIISDGTKVYKNFRKTSELKTLAFYVMHLGHLLSPIGQVRVADDEIVNEPSSIKRFDSVYLAEMLRGPGYASRLRRTLKANRMLKHLAKGVVRLETSSARLQAET